jgi:hypothetical protein
VLINRPTLNILNLENLGLPGWRLSVAWDRWREVRWLERVSERLPSKIWVLPSGDGMVYRVVPLFLLLFVQDSLKHFLVWAIV